MWSSHQRGSPSVFSFHSESGTGSVVTVTSSPTLASTHEPTRMLCQSSIFLSAPTPMPAVFISMNSPGASRNGSSRRERQYIRSRQC